MWGGGAALVVTSFVVWELRSRRVRAYEAVRAGEVDG